MVFAMNLRKSSRHSGRSRKNTNYGDVNEYYERIYGNVVGVDARGIMAYLSSYPHKLLERPFPSNDKFVILELGCGQNEHFAFVAKDLSRYYALDFKKPRQNPTHPNFEFIEASATNIPLESSSVNRVVLTCLLLHLNDPETVLLEIKRVLKSPGFVSIYIPTEPSFLLRLFRSISSKRHARKLGYEGYDLFIIRDHITYFSRILTLIRYHFDDFDIAIRYRPFFIPFWHLNALCVIQLISRVNSTRI
jgi:SAM-dependent methyltransferase